jgi:hypothetical protein
MSIVLDALPSGEHFFTLLKPSMAMSKQVWHTSSQICGKTMSFSAFSEELREVVPVP